MLKNYLKYTGLLGALFFCLQGNAQHSQSSYSVFGVGDIQWGGYSHNAGMAGLGVSYNSRFTLNNINPALMSTNFESVFQLGLATDNRTIAQNNDQGNQSYTTGSGGFKDFGFVLPIKYAKWNMGFGLSPITTVNYGFTTTDPNGPEGSTAITTVEGRGGIDEVFWNNSLKLGNFLVGLKLSYLFGSIQEENIFELDGITSTAFGNSAVDDTRNFSGANTTLGVAYKKLLKEESWLNLGAFYTTKASLNSTRLARLENQSAGGATFSTDTLINNVRSDITLPARFGVGISYEKFQTLMLGVDFQTQDWSQYIGDGGLAEPAYTNAFRLAIGGEIVPNYQDFKLLNRISYRFGVHYEKTPFVIDGQDVNDVGINFGSSIPLSAFWGVSHVNLGFTLGRRGNLDNVRESYFRFSLGFSLQDLTWFSRGKFD